jgi:hypothetical protein
MITAAEKKTLREIMDGLDKMLVALHRSNVWNFSLVRHYLATTEIVCKKINDFELYKVAVHDLVKKWFFKLPNTRKWEALSLMKDELTSGNVANELGEYFMKNIHPSQLQLMIRQCPDPTIRNQLATFRIYYKKNK